ncbi:MAG: carboxypeptidase regulatory-like domain-containing protein [Bacteroides sp.]|nr:carboxypeptidase regulatory-like domain-containing protein [Ruminococcus flavefaciens]MCM1555173.1 carboxypeptidase regulatory-like domain-containing protein [Bacteroides sp.]
MKTCRNLFLCLALSLSAFPAESQQSDWTQILAQRGEVKFGFVEPDASKIAELSRIVSIDRRKDSLYTAYASQEEFARFLALGYQPLEVEEPAAKAGIEMASTVEEMQDWNRYPTYPVYLEMMRDFAANYPDLCRIDTIGTSVKGRLILCLRLCGGAENREELPGFFYSSSIHGDELTGFVLMLRLADYLLERYGSDEEVTRLLNGMRLYINPLSNPDGAYAASDNSVSGATRYNANRVDLNRNYPDFWAGNPATIQKENQAMMDYVRAHEFVMSVNIHGGSDVLNFPWDGFTSSRKKHADYDWWTQVSRRYVDSCRLIDATAYRDVNANGYVDGGDWYVVNNGRQDYMNVYRHVREQTLEISVTKMPASSRLPSFWNINHRSLINYMKEALYGIKGRVCDSLSGEPLRALVTVEGHDKDSSQVYSSAMHGMFYRPMAAGRYDLRFSAPGYADKVIPDVEVRDFSAVECNVLLARIPQQDTTGSDTVANRFLESVSDYRISPNPAQDRLVLQADFPFAVRAVYAVSGREMKRTGTGNEQWANRQELEVSSFVPGIYVVEVRAQGGAVRRLKFIKR